MKNFPQFPSPKSLAGHPRWALLLMILASIVLPAASPSLRAQTLFPFRYEPHEGGIIITGYTGTGGDVAIPGTIDGLPVTTIGGEVFAGSELTSVVVPEGVTDIGEGAFADSVGLTNVTLPKTLNSIGSRAFQRCTGLSRISVPDGVRWINGQAFEGCARLEQVTLGQSLEYLAAGLFHNCTALMELTIPDSVDQQTSLFPHQHPFLANCTGLRKLHLGRGVTWVPNLAQCTNLTSITVADDHSAYRSIDGALFSRDKTSLIFVPLGRSGRYDVPAGVQTIEYGALHNLQNLVEVVLPDSLVSIKRYEFDGCTGIRQITILGSDTYIGELAFGGCPGLVYVKFSGNAPRIPWKDTPLFDDFPGPVNTTVLYLPGTSGWGARLGGAPTAPWLPAIGRPATAADQPEGSFGFAVEWAPNRQVTVEACSDLAQRDWQPMGSLILDANGTAQFRDPDSNSQPTRLYRLRTP